MRFIPSAAVFFRLDTPAGCLVVGANDYEDFGVATYGREGFADRDTFCRIAAGTFLEYLARGIRAGELD